MLAKTLGDYGAPFENLEAVVDPNTEQSAEQGNLLMEDSAQLTQTPCKAIIQFKTTSTAGPVSASVTAARLLWGQGVSYYPTVTKNTTGNYSVQFSSTYTDGLGETESPAFFAGLAQPEFAGTAGYCQVTATSTLALVDIRNTSGVNSDLGGTKTITLWLY